jgi:N-acetylglucosamine malate deacetylase 1
VSTIDGETSRTIAAHPDDIEFVMAGTLLRLRDVGHEIHYLNLANGCCGSTEYDATTLASLRREEARAACALVGAVFHESLVNDLEILYDLDTLRRLAAIVREVSPSIVLTHSPSDYMEDHTNTCRLAVTAAFARGMPNFRVDPPRPVVNGPVTLYHAQPHGNRDGLGQWITPTMFVDIGAVLEEKTAMLAKHQTQQAWLDESQGLNSYLRAMHDQGHEVGRLSGRFDVAEGWRRRHHLGFCDEGVDPLATALGPEVVLLQ